tara:strand:+ start:344 stop:1576 length:1233 start_codon:yes stop_codon:yes gene_type:complete
MQHKILLLDELGDRWGKTHVYHNLRSPSEALKLLYINYPDLQKYFATAHEDGIGFTVVQAGEFLGYEDLGLPLGKNDLVITPVITGSGGVGKTLLGAALIVVTGGLGTALGVTGGAGLFGITGGVAGAIGGVIGKLGVGLVLSGVSDIISPQTQLPDFDFEAPVSGFTGGAGGITRGSDGSQSYAYTGAANTVGLGKTIPVVYGKALVGGHILSTNIEVSNQSDPLMKYIRPPNFNTVLLNSERLETHYTNAGGVMARRYNDTTSNASGTQSYLTSNKVIDLQNEGEQKIADITGDSSGNTDVKKFQILFQVGGLIDFVGEEGTTKIDGFITYRIKIKERDDATLVLNNQSTIQGLTTKNQNYSYITKLPYQKISDKSNYEVLLEVIDTGVDFNKASFTIKQVGYNLKEN